MSAGADPTSNLSEIRRPLGLVFLGAGLFDAAVKTALALIVTGKRPYGWVTPQEFANLNTFQFLFMFFAGAAAIYRSFVRLEPRLIQIAVDFLFGILAFMALGWAVDKLLRTSWAGARMSWMGWLVLLAGLCLACYGARLMRGRQIWRRLELLID